MPFHGTLNPFSVEALNAGPMPTNGLSQSTNPPVTLINYPSPDDGSSSDLTSVDGSDDMSASPTALSSNVAAEPHDMKAANADSGYLTSVEPTIEGPISMPTATNMDVDTTVEISHLNGALDDPKPADVTNGTHGSHIPSTETANLKICSASPRSPSPRHISPKKRTAPDDDFEEHGPASKKSRSPSASAPEKAAITQETPPKEPAPLSEKEKWEGWCEIESDPAYISAMIRMMGVRGVSVRETFAIDIDEFKSLPQPVYGLIFLFRYREDDGYNPQEQTCPDNVWFANQLPAQNSCATLAMTNILMNTPGVSLGEHLEQFQDFTKDFTPYLRGEAFASFRFVKQIHNSFAKKMDIMEDDQTLANKVDKNKHSGGRRGSNDSNTSEGSLEDNAHHFIAFLPIDGHVWKLDGMDYQPTNLGAYDTADPDSWLTVAANRMAMLMAAAGDQDYSLLSVVQSPVATLQGRLAYNHAELEIVESCLNHANPDWRSFIISEGAGAATVDRLTPAALGELGISQERLFQAYIPDSPRRRDIYKMNLERLLAKRAGLVREQASAQNQLVAEMETENSEDEKARERQWDYGPVIQRWLEMLAENGHLEGNLERFMKK